MVSAVEEHSEHPLAQAVLQEADRIHLRDKYPPAQTVSALTGRGITGQVGEQVVIVSSHNHFHEIIPEKLAHHELVEEETRKGIPPSWSRWMGFTAEPSASRIPCAQPVRPHFTSETTRHESPGDAQRR